jgi:hypothetical protein
LTNSYKTLSFSVGNKNDAPDRKVVLTEDAQRFAGQIGIQLFETSAKDNINVEEVIKSGRRLHSSYFDLSNLSVP